MIGTPADPDVTKGAVRMPSKTTVCSVKWGKDEHHVTKQSGEPRKLMPEISE